MSGLAIECATPHVEIAVIDGRGGTLAHEIEDVGHGHTRRLVPLIDRALGSARLRPADLKWVAADLGPGSFTGVRVGLATAAALALASGARLRGAMSLETLAATSHARRSLVVPLLEAGRRDVYAGYFRANGKGRVTLLLAPYVGPVEGAIALAREAGGVLRDADLRFVGPGVLRERAALESSFPGSTAASWRLEGLSALDLAAVARESEGATASDSLRPLYVRPAQAEEKVRRRVLAAHPVRLRPFTHDDVAAATVIERRVFSDPWSEEFFHGEIGQSMSYGCVAEADGRLAGYSLAWLGGGEGHLGNLAVAPEHRRRGVARALLEDLLARAGERGANAITLEVRSSNFAAQALYRAYGFRLAGLRRQYYRDNGEDALVLAWSANP
ncbi:MAG: tRNA (adenosine(37)-N6)-threonylcarbamoyltransferase complex dimerization subunit type 1 TsaB [Candidatus Eisenbacteria bacterium]|nr:tRNA (adenosine(37)-N6)-threonylcarbamoyltransferase complex dimerization subunit type 1 TsaB [Candidatus Eisenbacteria bacterium]